MFGKPIVVIPVEFLLAVKLFLPACIRTLAPDAALTDTWPATHGKSWYIELAVDVVREVADAVADCKYDGKVFNILFIDVSWLELVLIILVKVELAEPI